MATSLDRLIRKEVSLGAIREKLPPMDHIGLSQIAPFLDVASDDAIFEYVKGGYQDGLAPQRAEDAEAELAQKDDMLYGIGRAAICDWALKDKYTASDVTRYREDLFISEKLQGDIGNLPLNFTGSSIADFQKRLARDDARRKRYLDNRIEWLIMSAIQNGGISYTDGKIKWTVDFGRPADQHNEAPASGLYNTSDFDPIGDFMGVSDLMWDRYGVRPKRVIASTKLVNKFWLSNRWLVQSGLVVGGTPSSPIDHRYAMPGFSKSAAIQAMQDACDMQIIVYDSVYQTRPIGNQVTTNNKFLDPDVFYFLPSSGIENTGQLGPIDDTQVGFAKTLTAPHPEANWQTEFYEWETPMSQDPWMQVRGSGVKAFPVFPYMELTYTMRAL